jgi:hypothetical protein
VGPTTPAPLAPAPSTPEPTFAPPEAPYAPAPPAEVWNPAPVESFEPVAPPKPEPRAEPRPAPVETPAGAGASWSIVSEEGKDVTQEAVTATGKKRKKEKVQTGSWQLASGEAPGDEYPDEIKGPSSAVAVAQYAVLVVGLVMVLIGVLVMVANSHVT